MIEVFTQDNWDSKVLKNPLPVVVCFRASWCPHCQAMQPRLEEAANSYKGQIVIGEVDVDSDHYLTREYKVSGIPHLFGFDNGSKVLSNVGEMSQSDLNAFVDKLISNIPWKLNYSTLHP